MVPAPTAGSAPGANATWNESSLQAIADSVSSSSKVWCTLGNGELENVFYPQTDTPDTFGLQYIVTDGSSFTDSETAGTSPHPPKIRAIMKTSCNGWPAK
jgi:glucoamylase